MAEFLLGHESEIHTLVFIAAIAAVALWEGIAPLRQCGALLRRRWRGNGALAVINIAIANFVFPVMAIGFAIAMEARGYGLLRLVEAPIWLASVLGIIAIELGHYAHHYLLHRVPLLWRFHRIHHADLDYDFTASFRFHPVESIFTILFVFAVIALVGPPPIAVLGIEVLFAVTAAVDHANGRIPQRLERHVRRIFVTPDMHRIHHSVRPDEHNSNYGGVFSVWDRLFGTYVAEPAQPHEIMEIGLPDVRDPDCLNLCWMLIEPFRKQNSAPVSSATPNPVRPEAAS